MSKTVPPPSAGTTKETERIRRVVESRQIVGAANEVGGVARFDAIQERWAAVLSLQMCRWTGLGLGCRMVVPSSVADDVSGMVRHFSAPGDAQRQADSETVS